MGVVGAVVVAVFGVFWTATAASMGAPGFFVAFGVVFIAVAVAIGIYHFYNATAANRFSELDIVPSGAEPDPFTPGARQSVEGVCSSCGAPLSSEFAFCPKCGKAVPAATDE